MSITTIKTAIAVVKDKGVETYLELYDAVDKQPGESVYSLAKIMSWSNGKTYAAARRLERSGMVHIDKAERNGRYVLPWPTGSTLAGIYNLQVIFSFFAISWH
jgi:predicted transcriptional regulator